jgi:transcriptional regulator with XRE-family HTH domain
MESSVPVVMTMSEVVGRNIRAARTARRWQRKELAEQVQMRGGWHEPKTVGRIERGEQRIKVDDLVLFGLALGVAPFVLLCPPAGTSIAIRPGEPVRDNYSLLGFVDDEDELLEVSGAILAHGPWEPGWGQASRSTEDLRAVKAWERDWWSQAAKVVKDLSPAERAKWEAGKRQRQLRDRLIRRLIPTLPPKIRRQLDRADGLWYLADVESAWYLPLWTIADLRGRARKYGLKVT